MKMPMMIAVVLLLFSCSDASTISILSMPLLAQTKNVQATPVQGVYPASTQAKLPSGHSVTINDITLTEAEVSQLSRMIGLQIQPGIYWYDPYCGAWGRKGGPCLGITYPGLPVRGQLKSDASGRTGTGVFVNGRELHPYDVEQLSYCTSVYAGHYWLDAQMNCGYAGGPRIFNLKQLCSQASKRKTRSGLISGSVMGDGNFIGFIDSEGRSVTIGD